MTEDARDAHTRQQQALAEALRAVLVPLARLAVARGLPFSAAQELMKLAFVQAASQAHPGLLPHRRVSRISTVTGINRREVTRLTQAAEPARRRGRSLVSELFAHWQSNPRYRNADGTPRVLPRQGPEPSFETLAQEITRDVHPRSLLDEMLRLQLADFDEAADTVRPAVVAVPRGDMERMFAFLGDNVGDHLRAAVDNVQGSGDEHFEQAIFAEGLSDATVDWVRRRVAEQWRQTLATLVPELEQRIAADAGLVPPPDKRLRLGTFTYHEAAAPDDAPDASAPPKAPR